MNFSPKNKTLMMVIGIIIIVTAISLSIVALVLVTGKDNESLETSNLTVEELNVKELTVTGEIRGDNGTLSKKTRATVKFTDEIYAVKGVFFGDNKTGFTLPIEDGNINQVLQTDGTGTVRFSDVSSTGDVVGPVLSTERGIAIFNDVDGITLDSTTVTFDDNNNMDLNFKQIKNRGSMNSIGLPVWQDIRKGELIVLSSHPSIYNPVWADSLGISVQTNENIIVNTDKTYDIGNSLAVCPLTDNRILVIVPVTSGLSMFVPTTIATSVILPDTRSFDMVCCCRLSVSPTHFFIMYTSGIGFGDTMQVNFKIYEVEASGSIIFISSSEPFTTQAATSLSCVEIRSEVDDTIIIVTYLDEDGKTVMRGIVLNISSTGFLMDKQPVFYLATTSLLDISTVDTRKFNLESLLENEMVAIAYMDGIDGKTASLTFTRSSGVLSFNGTPITLIPAVNTLQIGFFKTVGNLDNLSFIISTNSDNTSLVSISFYKITNTSYELSGDTGVIQMPNNVSYQKFSNPIIIDNVPLSVSILVLGRYTNANVFQYGIKFDMSDIKKYWIQPPSNYFTRSETLLYTGSDLMASCQTQEGFFTSISMVNITDNGTVGVMEKLLPYVEAYVISTHGLLQGIAMEDVAQDGIIFPNLFTQPILIQTNNTPGSLIEIGGGHTSLAVTETETFVF
jgi:hypothetical protein